MFRPLRRTPVAQARKLSVEALETRDVPSTLLVDDDRRQFKAAPYTTISAAVAAAQPGDTILVARGTYAEQVVIPEDKDDLTLVSDRPRQAVIEAPDTTTGRKAVVEVDGATNVTIRGFTITGPGDVVSGVQVVDGGSATITSNDIRDIRKDPLDGVQSGIGVLVGGLDLSDGPGTAWVVDNSISDYQKGGVVAIGEGTSATIIGNTITGIGPTDVIAQNGVQVSEGADGRVADNRISRHNYTGNETFASGIIVADAGDVTVSGNELTRNDVGLFASGTDDILVLGNDVRSSVYSGIFLFDLSGATVIGNRSSNNGAAGIYLESVTDSTVSQNDVRNNSGYGIAAATGEAGAATGASTGNTFSENSSRGNGAEDLFDDSTGDGTAGTANTWTSNRFSTSSPDGLQ